MVLIRIKQTGHPKKTHESKKYASYIFVTKKHFCDISASKFPGRNSQFRRCSWFKTVTSKKENNRHSTGILQWFTITYRYSSHSETSKSPILYIHMRYCLHQNTYEMVFSINDIPWSRKTIRRKTAQTMLQPYVQTPGISDANRNMKLYIRHYTTALVSLI